MSIFGVGFPAIWDEDDSHVITLTPTDTLAANSRYEAGYVMDNVVHVSVLTGKRRIVSKGRYWECTMFVNNIASKSDFDTYYKALLGTVVTVYPHRDVTSVTFNCIVEEVLPYYVNNFVYHDACRIKLRSESYVT